MRSRALLAGMILSLAAMVLAFPVVQATTTNRFIGCPFRAVTGLPCPTCGYLRFCQLAAHGHVGQAVRFQPFLPAIFGLSVLATLLAVRRFRQGLEIELPATLGYSIHVMLALSWIWNVHHGI